MKPLDLSSTLVAGLFGAVLLIAAMTIFACFTDEDRGTSFVPLLIAGFVVGAGVQAGVRLTGVS